MKKFLAVILAAVIFGGVAGVTIYGINQLGSRTQGSVSETEAAGTEAAAETAPSEETQASQPDIARSSDNSQAEADGSRSESTGNYSYARLDVSDIVEEAMPQVVSITNTMIIEEQGYSSLFDYFYGNSTTREYEVPASGSGVILSKTDDELLVITNNHVIEDSKELTVTFVDGTNVNANVKGYDSSLDIAVIAVPIEDIPEDTMDAIKVATYHDSDDLKVGQGVIAIGNALGYGQTVTVGYISALNREISAEGSAYSDLIQIDAAINPGNSGGALLNMDGEVIGINVAKLASSTVEATGYAIPIYKVMDVIENLSTAKTKVEVDEDKRGRLGVYMNTISSENAETLGIPAGVIIRGFSDEYMEYYGLENVQESPARAAGLLKNDIITRVDGQSVSSAEELAKLISYYEDGDVISVTYQRLENGVYNEYSTEVELGGSNDPVIDPVNEDEVPEEAYNSTNDGESSNEGFPSMPGRGRNPQQKQSGEEEEAAEETEQDTGNETGNDAGSEESESSASDTWNDMYDIFREFLEQYR